MYYLCNSKKILLLLTIYNKHLYLLFNIYEYCLYIIHYICLNTIHILLYDLSTLEHIFYHLIIFYLF